MPPCAGPLLHGDCHLAQAASKPCREPKDHWWRRSAPPRPRSAAKCLNAAARRHCKPGVSTPLRFALLLPPQAALDVAPEAVEPALIRAIGARLLEAKIDQIKGVVSISQALQASFGGGDWERVRSQLAAYRDNLAQVAALVAARQQQ